MDLMAPWLQRTLQYWHRHRTWSFESHGFRSVSLSSDRFCLRCHFTSTGKLLPVDPADHRCHSLFFDDNITLDAEESCIAFSACREAHTWCRKHRRHQIRMWHSLKDTKIVDVRDKTGKVAWSSNPHRRYLGIQPAEQSRTLVMTISGGHITVEGLAVAICVLSLELRHSGQSMLSATISHALSLCWLSRMTTIISAPRLKVSILSSASLDKGDFQLN